MGVRSQAHAQGWSGCSAFLDRPASQGTVKRSYLDEEVLEAAAVLQAHMAASDSEDESSASAAPSGA